MIEWEIGEKDRIEQGDIYADIVYIENIKSLGGDDIEIHEIKFPFVVVLSQDCDLSENSKYFCKNDAPLNDDKKLLSVIVAPIYILDLFLDGEHLGDESINYKMQKIPKFKKQNKTTTIFEKLINNETPRYHYLKFKSPSILPESVIDFKHFFTVNVQMLNENRDEKYICKIKPLYRESISQRFAYYLSRIGLPPDESPKSK